MSKVYQLLMLCLWTAVSWGQQATSLSLKECVNKAIQNSTKIKQSNLDVMKMEQVVKENLSTGYPQVNGNFQFNYNPALPAQLLPDFISPTIYGVLVKEGVKNGTGTPVAFPQTEAQVVPVRFGTDFSVNTGLQVEQLVYSQVFNLGMKAARKVVDFQKLFLTKNKEDIAHEVAKLYYQTQALSKQKTVVQANLEQILSMIKLSELQYKNGVGKKIDVDRLSVNKFNLETQITNISLQQDRQQLMLNYLMEVPLDSKFVLTDTISEDYVIRENIMEASPNMSNKISLKILDENWTLQDINARRYKAGYYPVVNAFLNYGLQGQGNSFDDFTKSNRWFNSAVVGLKANIPIYDSGNKKAKIQQIRVDQEKILTDKKFAEYSLNMQFQNAKKEYMVILNNLKPLADNKKLAQEVFRITQNRYKEGVAPITELLNSEVALTESNTNYLNALLQLKLSEIELDYNSGELNKLIEK